MSEGKRRIDRIRDPGYAEGLDSLTLEQVRERRDECLAEREYLSYLRRLVQGRAEILEAALRQRGSDGETSLVEQLDSILAGEGSRSASSRGEAVRVGLPEEDMLFARRRVERLVTDAAISDPTGLDDAQLAEAVDGLAREEQEVSAARGAVIQVLDKIQDELKRRYKADPTQALR
ncbi:MAG TPA: aerial mycelium formation protein [Actinomycetota bacterium]|nr:aerial mycelium formation protein [Actinomycetota bacterium]